MCVYVHYVLVNVLLRNRANSLCSDTWKEIHSEELTHRVVESEKSYLSYAGELEEQGKFMPKDL